MSPANPVISALRERFPEFSDRWNKYVASWDGESPGSYIDMAEFVHFVVEDLYEKGNVEETRRIFGFLEQLLTGADQQSRDLIGFGFFETLQTFASWRPHCNEVYEQFCGPVSKQIWTELRIMWEGNSSLADVIRAERSSKRNNPG